MMTIGFGIGLAYECLAEVGIMLWYRNKVQNHLLGQVVAISPGLPAELIV